MEKEKEVSHSDSVGAANGKLVFISSPYAGNIDKNVEFACAACRYAMARGDVPIAVHLLYPQMLDDGVPEERQLGLKLGLHILNACQEIWVCGDAVSPGMSLEIAEAKKLGKPVIRIPEAQITGSKNNPDHR